MGILFLTAHSSGLFLAVHTIGGLISGPAHSGEFIPQTAHSGEFIAQTLHTVGVYSPDYTQWGIYSLGPAHSGGLFLALYTVDEFIHQPMGCVQLRDLLSAQDQAG